MKPAKALLQELDHLAEHIEALRRLLLIQETGRKRKPKERWTAWEDLIREISAKWAGPDAVTEIRQQREKGY